MSTLRTTVARLFGRLNAEAVGAPEAQFTLAPTTADDTAAVLRFATDHGLSVLPWGGGTHQFGPPEAPDVVVVTGGLSGIDWRPADLTLVAGAGVTVSDLEDRLGEQGQSAMLPEHPGGATVGGVIAAGVSGWRRLRFGPTRDRILEVVAVTGDGRVIRGGGQVVKNVTGYDLPRLYTGSFGALGVITRVCLKLWPRGTAAATVIVDDPERARAVAYRPLAILEVSDRVMVFLSGTAAEVDAQAAALGGVVTPALVWPDPPRGEVEVSIRVPPARTVAAVEKARPAGGFVAAHGIGEVTLAGSLSKSLVAEWREWAESSGGAVVIMRAPSGFGLDTWGTPPNTVELQRRIQAAFDPAGVLVPGRLAGSR